MELKDVKKRMFEKNPKLKKEYDKLEPEYKIIEQIIRLRKESNLTQDQVAKLMKSKQSCIARLESGEYNPSLEFLKRVADVLNTKLDIRFIPKAS
ncbi:MAG: helix-turn-helix domain-containing protein [Nanoarchaeota archaeon]|nr:helix-turn-helix domain-containing protein [Nanoarchaeota archaeon]MCG2720068.1 helix-turn-helix domain-containing protein [Nanoarchaeota archaeon]